MPRDSGFPSTPRGSQDERRARRRLLRELNDLDLSLAEPLLDLEEDDIADPAELSVEEAHDQLAAAEFSEAYRDLFSFFMIVIPIPVYHKINYSLTKFTSFFPLVLST